MTIATGKGYTENGSEQKTPFSGEREYEKTTAPTLVDGAARNLDTLQLKDDEGNGYTYYKLRDLGAVLGVKVDWAAERGIYVEAMPKAEETVLTGVEKTINQIWYGGAELIEELDSWKVAVEQYGASKSNDTVGNFFKFDVDDSILPIQYGGSYFAVDEAGIISMKQGIAHNGKSKNYMEVYRVILEELIGNKDDAKKIYDIFKERDRVGSIAADHDFVGPEAEAANKEYGALCKPKSDPYVFDTIVMWVDTDGWHIQHKDDFYFFNN